MMTPNTRTAYKVITKTLAVGCLTIGVSWLEPLALPVLLIPELPRSWKSSRWLALAGVVLCVGAAVWLFINAWHQGAVLTRKPVPLWKLIACAIYWVCMAVSEGFSWWEGRAQDPGKPETNA
jgi:hypothetical protein